MNIINKKCSVCPIGCQLAIVKDELNPNTYIVQGNRCNRGEEFGIKEVLEPSRVLTSRVLLKHGPMGRIPVKTDGVIPEDLVQQCMEIIKTTEVEAPVKRGQIIIENILNTGVNVVAARRVNRL